MKAIFIYVMVTLLLATGCKKGMMDMMADCQKDQVMCRSMCDKVLDTPDGVERVKNQGLYIKVAETGLMDKEATLNKMMEMCTKDKAFCRELCGKMMNNGGMMGMRR